jgi:hypothetical protein
MGAALTTASITIVFAGSPLPAIRPTAALPNLEGPFFCACFSTSPTSKQPDQRTLPASRASVRNWNCIRFDKVKDSCQIPATILGYGCSNSQKAGREAEIPGTGGC